jgi:purine-nucleoside phosphorylase
MISSTNLSNPPNCGTVSAKSWAFEPNSAAARLVEQLRRTAAVERFDLALVLGSGWGGVATLGEELVSIDYADWPCFPSGQTNGHAGRLVAIELGHWKVLCFCGRFHCYQGLSAFEAALPIRLAAALGCGRILLTCATGGINPAFACGDFMLVEDHINLLGDNPLRGLTQDPFVNMTDCYLTRLYESLSAELVEPAALHRGVLAAMPGPSYETPAEIRLLAAAGADVVGMSTVPEAIMARYLGMQVAAVAFIANRAAGLDDAPLSHSDVLACGERFTGLFPSLVAALTDSWTQLNDI